MFLCEFCGNLKSRHRKHSDCNVSAIASAVVAQDSTSPDIIGASRLSASSNTSLVASADEIDEPSESEKFVQRLESAVQSIDRVISEHIGEHHATLLEQVSSVDELQDQFELVRKAVSQYKYSVHSLQAQVREQHENLRDTIQRYRNVEQCGDIVQRVLRFQHLSDRVLKSELNEADATSTKSVEEKVLAGDARQNEMASVALAIREIEQLVKDQNFEMLSVVRAKLPAVRQLTINLQREVRTSLRAGIHSLSQVDIGDALQIVFYLGDLPTIAQASVNDVIQELERECTAAISEDKLVQSADSSSSGMDTSNEPVKSLVQKSNVWKAVQDVFDVIRTYALQVWNLQRVLIQMSDPASGKKYLDLVLEPDEPSLFATFWEVTCAIVQELFASTLSYSAAVKSLLVSEYPRMREQAIRLLNELFASTKQTPGLDLFADPTTDNEADIDVGKSLVRRELVPIAGSLAERSQLLNSMTPLYDAYIDRAYRRMSNPITLMFPQSSNFHASPPGRSDIQTLSRSIISELEHAGQDSVLLNGTLQQLRKAVKLFCSNVEKIMHQGKSVSTTTPSFGRTPAQAHNVALIHVLSLLDETLEEVEHRMETAASLNGSQADAAGHALSAADFVTTSVVTLKKAKALCTANLLPSRDMINDLKYALLGSYLQALAVILESILAKMHDESFGNQSAATKEVTSVGASRSTGHRSAQSTNGSKYMNEFCNAFAVVHEEHLRRLPTANFVTTCLADFVERIISVFVRHASLLRPLSMNGKQRLADDMTQLELRLEKVTPLKNIGKSYEELQAFRHMIILDNSEILRDSTIDKIRPSNVWHHLTSRAPPELQLPHQMKNWSASKYIEWLEIRGANSQVLSPPTTPPSSSNIVSNSLPSWKELPLGFPCLKNPRLSLQAEKQAWNEMAKCLDAYSQRVSASTNVDRSPIYDLLQESSAILLAGYEVTLSRYL
ncbi:putative oligomeric Golgi complex subunit 5 protein [Plasmopara halstedii]